MNQVRMQDSSWAVGWQHTIFPICFQKKHESEKIWVRRIRGGWMGTSGLPRLQVNVPMFSKSIKFQREDI